VAAWWAASVFETRRCLDSTSMNRSRQFGKLCRVSVPFDKAYDNAHDKGRCHESDPLSISLSENLSCFFPFDLRKNSSLYIFNVVSKNFFKQLPELWCNHYDAPMPLLMGNGCPCFGASLTTMSFLFQKASPYALPVHLELPVNS
jgi:hypothetical protein